MQRHAKTSTKIAPRHEQLQHSTQPGLYKKKEAQAEKLIDLFTRTLSGKHHCG